MESLWFSIRYGDESLSTSRIFLVYGNGFHLGSYFFVAVNILDLLWIS